MLRRHPADTERDSHGLALAYVLPWSALCRQQSRLEGRVSKRKEREGQGWSAYSGKVSMATSDFILKYWLKRRTAYLRVETHGQLDKQHN